VAPENVVLNSTAAQVAILCVARGTPLPRIRWEQNGQNMTNTATRLVHQWVHQRNGVKQVASVLQVCFSQSEMGGQHRCIAENQFTSDEASFTVAAPGII